MVRTARTVDVAATAAQPELAATPVPRVASMAPRVRRVSVVAAARPEVAATAAMAVTVVSVSTGLSAVRVAPEVRLETREPVALRVSVVRVLRVESPHRPRRVRLQPKLLLVPGA
jgi:hypothetical protein